MECKTHCRLRAEVHGGAVVNGAIELAVHGSSHVTRLEHIRQFRIGCKFGKKIIT